MSLFDTLRCDYPLPDPGVQQWTFHTRDLRCLMDQYRLDAEGRLTRLHPKLYNPPRKQARPAPEPEDVGYHGDLRFHSQVPARKQVAYVARFTHGIVEWIRRVEEAKPVFTDSLKRLAQEARQLEQERQARLAQWLQRLERLDPEVAKLTIEAFDDRQDAALWLIAVSLGPERLSPYAALALRKRHLVLAALDQMSGASRDRRESLPNRPPAQQQKSPARAGLLPSQSSL